AAAAAAAAVAGRGPMDWATRCVDTMRGTWEAGLMVLKVWGRGGWALMVPGIFWKCCGLTPCVVQRGLGLNWASWLVG
ncbi:hypothetical protein DKP78_13970, partial [Enterococcus faecium]